MTDDELDDYAARIVADWRPLTEEEAARIAILLRPDPPLPSASGAPNARELSVPRRTITS